MELKLNVYKGQQIEKTYIANDFILTTGICEDVLKAVDIEKITSGVLDERKLGLEIISIVVKSFDKFRPFIQSIFEGLTDEEYSRTAVKDVGRVLFKVVTYTLNELANVGADEPKKLTVGEAEHLSIYQILFDLQVQINDIYHISMFEIRRTNFHEFCLLVDRTGDRNRREKKKTHNGLKKVRAGDNWF